MTHWLVTAVMVLLAMAPPARAQQVGRVPKIGYPSAFAAERDPYFKALLQGLQDLGYVPGRNILIEHRHYATDDQMRKVIDEFVTEKVDIIFGGVPVRALAAKKATSEIPIICASCGDPVGYGLVPSLARPAGNVTGLASLSAELIGKRLELLKEALPRASRVALVLFPNNPGIGLTLEAVDSAAARLGIAFHRTEVRTAADFEAAFRSAAKARVAAVFVQDDPLVPARRTQIASLALTHRLPVVTGTPNVVDTGVLFAYGPDRLDLFRRSAVFVDRVLKGAKPSELPFEQPTKLDFVVNLKTAKALDLTIPRSLLLRAGRIVE